MQGCAFREWPFLEDLEWVKTMNRTFGKPAIAGQPVHASPRRWLYYGVAKTTAINQLVLAGFALGVPVHALHRFYTGARCKYVGKNESEV
jgi:hypothetical protein